MGQYYKAWVLNARQEGTIESWDFDNGSKLMEHSWWGNSFVNAVMYMIKDNPSVVAWVGDYSDDVACPELVYKYCWPSSEEEEDKHRLIPEPPENYLWDDNNKCRKTHGTGYIVNYNRCSYIDLDEYIANNEPSEAGWDGIVHPLPLLTSIGNGQGGGDYHKGRAFDMVGTWFGDVIEYTAEKPPEAFEDITDTVLFKEER